MSGVQAWWWERRSTWPDVSMAALVERKDDLRVAVVIPARNEEHTVAGVVAPVVEELVDLVDEVLVIDGRSVDGTAAAARAAGARVLSLPKRSHGFELIGKGGALWWAQAQTDADLLVLLDADVVPSHASTVSRLLTPLLLEPQVSFVKAAFDRPLTVEGLLRHGSGGRVTELLARPVLNAWWPQLAGFVQPLAGEVAVRRSLLRRLPFAVGYGLEMGMLIDVLAEVGLPGMAQADIGERFHRHQSDAELGLMSAAVLAAALHRRGDEPVSNVLLQFSRTGDGLRVEERDVPRGTLPAVDTLPAGRRAG